MGLSKIFKCALICKIGRLQNFKTVGVTWVACTIRLLWDLWDHQLVDWRRHIFQDYWIRTTLFYIPQDEQNQHWSVVQKPMRTTYRALWACYNDVCSLKQLRAPFISFNHSSLDWLHLKDRQAFVKGHWNNKIWFNKLPFRNREKRHVFFCSPV